MRKAILCLMAAVAVSASAYGIGLEIAPKVMLGGTKSFYSVSTGKTEGLYGALALNYGGQLDVTLRLSPLPLGVTGFLGISSLPFGTGVKVSVLGLLPVDTLGITRGTYFNFGGMAKVYLGPMYLGLGGGMRYLMSASVITTVNGEKSDLLSGPIMINSDADRTVPFLAGSLGFSVSLLKIVGIFAEANVNYNFIKKTEILTVTETLNALDFGASAGVFIKVF